MQVGAPDGMIIAVLGIGVNGANLGQRMTVVVGARNIQTATTVNGALLVTNSQDVGTATANHTTLAIRVHDVALGDTSHIYAAVDTVCC